MFQRMLVLLDGSELAEVVFPYAKELAARLELDVILLNVCSPVLRDFAPMQQAYIQRAADTIRRQTREVQENLGMEAESKRVEIRGEVVIGYHADEILRFADENAVDFILLASHGRSGIKRWSLGGVADKILMAAKVPVWLVRAGIEDETPYDQWPTKTILAPLDGSERAEAVLPYVETLAKQRSTEPINVALLRICEPPVTPSYYSPELSGVPLNWGEFMEQETARSKQVSKEYLGGIAKRFMDTGINTTTEVLVGKAADEIIDYANKNLYSVIAMATHGRSGLSRLVYGSTAESVLVGLKNPILLVKAT